MRKCIAVCVAASFLLFSHPAVYANTSAEALPTQRFFGKVQALSIGLSDYPGSAYDMGEAPRNNARSMQRLFQEFFEPGGILQKNNLLLDASRGEITDALVSTFSDSAPEDIHYLYYSGHSDNTPDATGATLTTMDDTRTAFDLITPSDLYQALTPFAGRFVLILDCNHAAGFFPLFSPPADTDLLWGNEPDIGGYTGLWEGKFQVIAATLPDELAVSYGEESAAGGAFTTALLSGLGKNPYGKGGVHADLNGDGTVSLGELDVFLQREVPSSSPHIYGDHTLPFLPIPTEAPLLTRPRILSPLLRDQKEDLSLSFSLLQESSVAYGIYDVSHFSFSLQQKEDALAPFAYQTGRWERKEGDHTVSLKLPETMGSGTYFLRLVPEGEGMAQHVFFQLEGLSLEHPGLELSAPKSYQPHSGELYPITLTYEMGYRPVSPCTLSLLIEDMEGTVLRTLEKDALAPVHEKQDWQTYRGEALFFWDGRKEDGTYAPSGSYRIRATASYTHGKIETIHYVLYRRPQIRLILRGYLGRPLEKGIIYLNGRPYATLGRDKSALLDVPKGSYQFLLDAGSLQQRGILRVAGSGQLDLSLYDGNAQLKDLQLYHRSAEGDSVPVPFLDRFHPGNSSYLAILPHIIEEVEIRGMAQHKEARVEGLGFRSLHYGLNLFSVRVMAENGLGRIYHFRIIREYPPVPEEPEEPVSQTEEETPEEEPEIDAVPEEEEPHIVAGPVWFPREEGRLISMEWITESSHCLFLLLSEPLHLSGHPLLPVQLDLFSGWTDCYALLVEGTLDPGLSELCRKGMADALRFRETQAGMFEILLPYRSVQAGHFPSAGWGFQSWIRVLDSQDIIMHLSDNLGETQTGWVRVQRGPQIQKLWVERSSEGSRLVLSLPGRMPAEARIELYQEKSLLRQQRLRLDPGNNRVNLTDFLKDAWDLPHIRLRIGLLEEGGMSYGKLLVLTE